MVLLLFLDVSNWSRFNSTEAYLGCSSVIYVRPLRGNDCTRQPTARKVSSFNRPTRSRDTTDSWPYPSLANCMRGGRLPIMWVDSSDLCSRGASFIHHIACGNLSPGMSENLKLSRPSGFGEWCNVLHRLQDIPFRLLKWWAFWWLRIFGYTGLRTTDIYSGFATVLRTWAAWGVLQLLARVP